MREKRFSEEQIIGILHEHDAGAKWTCPGLVESVFLTPGMRSRTGPCFDNPRRVRK